MSRFIAEISSNHNGDLARCRAMIAAAAEAGCHGVKFQLFRIEHLFAREILQVSPEHRRRRRWELPPWFLPELAVCAGDHGLQLGCTPFDREAVDLLAPHVDFLKIASYELPWLGLTAACAATGLPLMISTGMADAAEITAAVTAAVGAGCRDLTVFHCVSAYPVPAGQCNLAAIGALRDLAGPLMAGGRLRLGWSDHSVSAGVVRRAVDHWRADTVEFHFDLEGGGEEFTGGHCWLPRDIAPVIAGRSGPAAPPCDGDGSLGPVPEEMTERGWRTDPGDGLRPTLTVRKTWPAAQSGARHQGPRLAFLPAGLGLGHLMRCLALAEALRENHDADPVFLVPETADQTAMLDRHGLPWLGIPPGTEPMTEAWLEAVRRRLPAGLDACVVDTQQPAGPVIDLVRAAGLPAVLVDQPEVPGADLGIIPSLSWRAPDGRPDLKGGPDYLLVREDLRRLRPEFQPGRRDGPLVITFGGADPHRLSERCLALAAADLPAIPVQVVVGPGFAGRRERIAALQDLHPGARLITTGGGLERLIADAGLLVTALGVTVGEALCLGAPTALLTNWETDRPLAEALHREGLVWDLGHHAAVPDQELAGTLGALWADSGQRTKLAIWGWRHCDGRGAGRAAGLIAGLVGRRKGGAC